MTTPFLDLQTEYCSSHRIEYTVKRFKSPLCQWQLISALGLIILTTWFVLQSFQLGILYQITTLSFLSCLTFINLKDVIIQESLLAVNKLGLQLSQTNAIGRQCSIKFVHSSEIKGIVINETIKRHRVISYLAVILRSPDSSNCSILPIFRETLPRLTTLKKIYNELQNLLNN